MVSSSHSQGFISLSNHRESNGAETARSFCERMTMVTREKKLFNFVLRFAISELFFIL